MDGYALELRHLTLHLSGAQGVHKSLHLTPGLDDLKICKLPGSSRHISR